MRKILLLTSVFLIISNCVMAQRFKHGMGCHYDPDKDGKVPQKARLMTRDFTSLPKTYSLKKYCPTPKSQAQYGTCTGWASGYAARTICEAIANSWVDKEIINKEAFSALFIYKNIESKPTNCKDGSCISDAMALMKNKGAAKYNSFDVLCADYVPSELFSEALNFKIDDYTRLFCDTYLGVDSVTNKEKWESTESKEFKILSVKKALSQDHPIVIGMVCYDSFDNIIGDLWNGSQEGDYGGHALCVIGYDDDKYGGAFEIMNSWGKNWANSGFVWITYEDFYRNVKYAYDVYVKKKEKGFLHDFSGDMHIGLKDGDREMSMVLKEKDNIVYYKATGEFLSGQRFRLYVSNDNPAWVYVIASDLKNNITKLFPESNSVSAYLNYQSSHIAIPGESSGLEFTMDNVPGTDYFCVLYSQEELDIEDIIQKMKTKGGSFYSKLNAALGDKLAPNDDIRFIQNRLGFSAKSNRTVVPLVVEITHKDINIKSGNM